jgi:hypothetical protein
LIVLLSDHGEEFNDHGGFGHGHTLYEELIRVPLLFSLPGKLASEKRIDRQVRLLDIVPTILDLLEIRPWTHLEGTSLMPAITGAGDVGSGGASLLAHRFAYSEAMLYGAEQKSVTAYPWKLIYDTVTEEVTLLNLSSDPGETRNLADTEFEIMASLEEVLVKTLLATSDTWFVEAVSGEETHVLDIKVGLMREPMSGRLGIYRVLDSEGHLVDGSRVGLTEVDRNLLKIEEIELKGSLTLAFTVEPQLTPVIFDFRIDGAPAEGATFLGRTLFQPVAMPFMEQATRKSRIMGDPPERPEPPYILVRQPKDVFGTSSRVRLTGDTERELRALGYIQ